MNMFCPFLKDKCKGNECAMWKGERCLIISFMEDLMTPPERTRETQVPDEIASATPEELAAELISFAKKEYPDDEEFDGVYGLAELFWESKMVSGGDIPTEIKLKIQKAEMLADRALDIEREVREKERQAREKERIKREETDLPSLVSLCVDWAKDRGLKTVTKLDIRAFLMHKHIDILPETQKSLHALVNVELRSKY